MWAQVAQAAMAAADSYQKYMKDKTEQQWKDDISNKLEMLLANTQEILNIVRDLRVQIKLDNEEIYINSLIEALQSSRKSLDIVLFRKENDEELSSHEIAIIENSLTNAQEKTLTLEEKGPGVFLTLFSGYILCIQSWMILLGRDEVVALCRKHGIPYFQKAIDPNIDGSFGNRLASAERFIEEVPKFMSEFLKEPGKHGCKLGEDWTENRERGNGGRWPAPLEAASRTLLDYSKVDYVMWIEGAPDPMQAIRSRAFDKETGFHPDFYGYPNIGRCSEAQARAQEAKIINGVNGKLNDLNWAKKSVDDLRSTINLIQFFIGCLDSIAAQNEIELVRAIGTSSSS